jgi:hypothetical protein
MVQIPKFDGKTYDPRLDHERLGTSLGRVWMLMRDGKRRTLAQIAEAVGCSEAGASARLRDLRKSKFSEQLPTDSVSSSRGEGGLWWYWIVVPPGAVSSQTTEAKQFFQKQLFDMRRAYV